MGLISMVYFTIHPLTLMIPHSLDERPHPTPILEIFMANDVLGLNASGGRFDEALAEKEEKDCFDTSNDTIATSLPSSKTMRSLHLKQNQERKPSCHISTRYETTLWDFMEYWKIAGNVLVLTMPISSLMGREWPWRPRNRPRSIYIFRIVKSMRVMRRIPKTILGKRLLSQLIA